MTLEPFVVATTKLALEEKPVILKSVVTDSSSLDSAIHLDVDKCKNALLKVSAFTPY